jgi:hypothetical protein
VTAAALALALIGTLAIVAGAEPDGRSDRYRSLDASERARALGKGRDRARPALAARRAADAPAREEVLLIERHREPKGTAGEGRRRADVYIYDYASDTLSLVVVDLDSGEAETVRVAQDAQLPLTENEIVRATALFYAQPAMRQRLEREFERIAGEPLEDLSALHIRAFVFRADSMPDTAPKETAVCGRHRCAQLMIYTEDKVAVEWLPVIDLSRERVLDSVAFGMSPPERSAPPGKAHEHHSHDAGHSHGP